MLIKSFYELSLWQDYAYTDEVDGKRKFSENKAYILGGSEADFVGKAENVVLRENVNGTSYLEFQLMYNYYLPKNAARGNFGKKDNNNKSHTESGKPIFLL